MRWFGAAPGAPLVAAYRETPLWWDDAAMPQGAQGRSLPADCDVVVVGAGYTGLTAARELARRGRHCVVLDRGALGEGASGRNAGMVHAGFARDLDDLERRHGPLGRALFDISVEAYDFVARTAERHAPDCHYERSGWVRLAHRPSRLETLRREERLRRERLGETTRLLAGSEVAEETQAHGVSGALVTDHGAGLHPARYLAGIARAALGDGAVLHEHVAVTRVTQRRGSGMLVRTTAGEIAARDVLMATNGYTDAAVPGLRRRILPIGSYVIATEPLPAELADTVTARRRMLTDTRDFLHYWRLSPDRRLVFGGRTSFHPVALPGARDRLYADMTALYPQLGGVRLSHAWTGRVGFTFDRLPHLGRRDGITYAMGYCGSGVALGSWLGTCAGAWIAGDDPVALAQLRFPSFPGYTGVPWFLPAVGWYHQLRDRLG